MRTHRFDGVSFVSGIVITAIGLLFLIPNAPTEVFENLGNIGGWIWPLLFVSVGIAVLVPALSRARNESDN